MVSLMVIVAYRSAHTPLHPNPLEYDPRNIYHSLCPLPALSPVPDPANPNTVREQKANEAAYRQLLIEGCLTVLLPTEDLENGCLTALVGQILSEMIIGNGIGGKASEPWVLWEGIMKGAEISKEVPSQDAQAQGRLDASEKPISEQSGHNTNHLVVSLQKTFWLVLQYMFVAFTILRFIINAIATSSSLPSRLPSNVSVGSQEENQSRTKSSYEEIEPSKFTPPPSVEPIISMKVWSCISRLLDLDIRMPWVSASIKMLQWGGLQGPGMVGNTDGMLDK